MKTTIRLWLLFVLFYFPLFFEVSEAQQFFNAGLTGGLLTSNIPGEGTGLYKAGLTGGIIVNSSLNSNLMLQLEFNYIQKGATHPADSNNQGYFKYSLNYFEVPLLIRRHLHFTMFKKPANGFDFETGASFARLFSYSYIYNNYTQSLYASPPNKTDVSLLIGLDYNISPNLYLCLRYSNSVISSIKHTGTVVSSEWFYTWNAGNNVDFQITLKYIFGHDGVIEKDTKKE